MIQDDKADGVELRINQGVQTNIFLSESSLRSISESARFDLNTGAGVVLVNDSLFVMDDGDNRGIDEEIQEFEVHAERVNGMENGFDDEVYCSTPPVSDNGTDENHPTLSDDAPLKIKRLQKVSCGYVINSNVYLTENQWHTLILDEGINKVYCALCDEYLDVDTAIMHLEDEMHEMNILSHEPIKRFELSITRKIRNKYHCAVCNEIFDDSEDEKHVDNEKHGDNILFAINKASDIVYDYNLENSYEATVDIATNHVPRNVNYSPVQMTVDNNEKPFNDDDYNSTPSNDYENDIFYDNDFQPQVFEVSYAAMAGKAKAKQLPTDYRIDLGDKIVTVKYDSWHMIMYCRTNEMYCMACLVFDHRRNKGEHCKTTDHLQKLKQCEVINAYETHLIRRVDDKLYHCGHCNNLQPISQMENHVEQMHPNTNKISTRNGVKIKGTPISNDKPKINDNNVFEIQEITVKEQNECTDNELFSYPIPNIANDYDNDKENIEQKNLNIEQNLFTNDGHNIQNILVDNQTIATNVFVDKTLTDSDTKAVARGANLLYKRNRKFLKEHAKQYFSNNLQDTAQDDLVTNENENQQQTKSYSKVTASPTKKRSPNKTNIASKHQKNNPFIYKPKAEDILTRADIHNIDRHTLITFMQFGHNLSLSVLSFNTILKPCELYCCATCDLMIEEKFLLTHILDIKHVALMQNVPYKAEFSFNLIRKIKKYLHCGICNMILPLDKSFVLNHNVSSEHALLLSKALGFENESPNNSNIVPKTNDKVPNNIDKIPNHNDMVLSSNNEVSNNKQKVQSNNDQESNNNAQKETEVINRDTYIDSEEDEVVEDLWDVEDNIDNFSFAEYILVKIKNIFIKLVPFSWHTLVEVGDDLNYYCFLCAIQIDCDNIMRHVGTLKHCLNMEYNKVLSNYGANVIRQIQNRYHCGVCNVIVNRKHLKHHLDWSKHLLNAQSSNSDNKNALGMSGIREVDQILQKEKTRSLKDHTKLNVILDVVQNKSFKKVSNDVIDSDNDSNEEKGDITMIMNGKAFHIDFLNWHGLVSFKSGYMCKLCGVNIGRDDASRHASKPKHLQHSKKPFLEDYPEDFIRQLSDSKLYCVVCNVELSTTEDINQHVRGKKHKKNREQLIVYQ